MENGGQVLWVQWAAAASASAQEQGLRLQHSSRRDCPAVLSFKTFKSLITTVFMHSLTSAALSGCWEFFVAIIIHSALYVVPTLLLIYLLYFKSLFQDPSFPRE